MKKLITKLVLASALFGLPLDMLAEDQVKGAERLTQPMKPLKTVEDVQAVRNGDTVAMACPKCKTISYSYVDWSSRGAVKDVKTVTKDICPGCNTKIVTTGVGKQARNEIQHTCKNCGSHDAFCCVLRKEDKAE